MQPATQPTDKPAPARPSRLGAIKKGVVHEPPRILIYGPEGVGKSSLAADAPSPIFLDTDRGSSLLHVARYPFRDGSEGHHAESLAEIYAAIDDLETAPHDFETLVLDSADAAESHVWAHVCERAPAGKGNKRPRTIDEIPWNGGYKLAAEEWRVLLHRLDRLRHRRGMAIVLVGHTTVKSYKNPLGEDYDRLRPRLDDRALSIVREWVDTIGFATFEDGAARLHADDDRDRPRAFTTGRRVVRFEHSPAFDAKTRLPLPAQVELSLEHPWAPFAAAIEASRQLKSDDLRALIEARLAQLGAVFLKPDGVAAQADAVRTAVGRAGEDVATLSRIHTALKQATPHQES